MQLTQKITFKPLSEEQCAKLLGATHGDMRGLILSALTTGQRIRDLINLRKGDVNPTGRMIHFVPARCPFLCPQEADSRFLDWLSEENKFSGADPQARLFPILSSKGNRAVARMLKRLGHQLGIDLNATSFRHTLILALYHKGYSVEQIKRFLGQKI
jgi:integrase